MKIEGIPIARDRAGNTLVRVPHDRGIDWGVEMANPAEGMTFSLYSPGNEELSRVAIQMDWEGGHPGVWHFEFLLEPMSVKWVRWIFLRFLGINIFKTDSRHLQVETLAPIAIPSGAWESIGRVLLEGDIEGLSRTVERSMVVPGMKKINVIIDKALVSVDLVGEYGSIDERGSRALSFVGAWALMMYRRDGLDLEVYRQGQEDGTVRIAYHLSASGAGTDKVDLHRFSLVDVLRDSGVWIEEGDLDAWLGEHMVQAEWLIDTSKLEMYKLLGVTSPLFWEYGECKEWAGYQE